MVCSDMSLRFMYILGVMPAQGAGITHDRCTPCVLSRPVTHEREHSNVSMKRHILCVCIIATS